MEKSWLLQTDIRQRDGLRWSTGKSRKKGQEDQGRVKGLGGHSQNVLKSLAVLLGASPHSARGRASLGLVGEHVGACGGRAKYSLTLHLIS